MKDIGVIVLAAGEGKRMKSKDSKVLCKLIFKPMIRWVIDSCENIGCKKSDICIVCPENNESIIQATDNNFNYVFQKERLGTAHAVSMARDFIKEIDKNNILIMLGDAPLVSENILEDFYNYHVEENNSLTVLSSDVKDPFGYGRIVRDKNNYKNLLKIVEELECDFSEKLITEINSGVMLFKKESLLLALDNIDNNNKKKEYYITSAVSVLLRQGKRVGVFNCHDEAVVLGANTRFQLLKINNIARLRIIEKLANEGVEFISSDGVIISPDVTIGEGSIIYPGVIIKSGTVIGKNCEITSSSYIESSQIGDGAAIKASYIVGSKIGNNVRIGPFSNVRPNCDIYDGVKIGDFVEVKNSVVCQKTSIAHLTYVGDSDVGENVNFGCGCVTVNYDGVNKYRTTIGDNCFIGCNTNLVAPVKIGNNAYTAAGSTVTEDVPDNSLCIARSRQVIKENWKIRNRK